MLFILLQPTHRYQDAVDKLVKALDTVGDIPPFVLRIRTDLCHCHSKVCKT